MSIVYELVFFIKLSLSLIYIYIHIFKTKRYITYNNKVYKLNIVITVVNGRWYNNLVRENINIKFLYNPLLFYNNI